jgi:hypothetical protein
MRILEGIDWPPAIRTQFLPPAANRDGANSSIDFEIQKKRALV